MSTIILNETELEFQGYNRHTYYDANDGVISNAYINMINGENTLASITALTKEIITSIKIKKDNEIIYELSNLNAQIQSSDESYDGNYVNINILIL